MLLGWPKQLLACDILHRAVVYLHHQFSVYMDGDEAQANCDARALLIGAQERVLDENLRHPQESA